jgi:hypothetical protein
LIQISRLIKKKLMKPATIITCLLLFFSLQIIAQDQLHIITGEVIQVEKAEYREKDNSLVFVDPETRYTRDLKLWTVNKLVLEDGSELTYEEYDKTFDIANHKQGDVYVTSTLPTNTELTLVVESSKEYMNFVEEGAINEIRKLAYHQGGNILYVQIDRDGNSGKYNVNYKIFTTFKFNPELFDTYLGTFGIEGFNDGIKLDDWSDPLYTTLGTNEKLIFKGDAAYEALSSKRIYEASLSFENDNLTINYTRVKKNGKRDEKSRTIRIVGNNQTQILALYNDSGYLFSLESE